MRVGVLFRIGFKGIISTASSSVSGRMSVVTSWNGTDTEIYGNTMILAKITDGIALADIDIRIKSVNSYPNLGTVEIIGRAVSSENSKNAITRVIFGTGSIDTSHPQTLDLRYCFDTDGNKLDCYTATIDAYY
jgi:hypothetical protein